MFKKISTIGLVIILILGIAGIKVLQIVKLVAMPQPVEVETVATTKATKQEWTPIVAVIGSVTAVQGTVLSAQLDGMITSINVANGAKVKAGDLLVQQDVSAEEAQLRSAEAGIDLAKVTLERNRDLLAKQTVSQSDFDTADANYKQAVANADNIKSTIAKKTIRAPFDGTVGIRLVNLGQMLKSGDQILPIETLDPVYVTFQVPQQRLADLREGLEVGIKSDTTPLGVKGKITAIDSDVDATTRNIKVQATLSNPKAELRPGMFVNVEVSLPTPNQVISIPATSILYAPFGDSVFVVDKKKAEGSDKEQTVARQQFVKLGAYRGDFVEVTDGLKEGDEVVTDGVFKLRNNVAISVNNAMSPKAEIAPKPNDS